MIVFTILHPSLIWQYSSIGGRFDKEGGHGSSLDPVPTSDYLFRLASLSMELGTYDWIAIGSRNIVYRTYMTCKMVLYVFI